MGIFDMMSISASALSAERQRAEITSVNLANAETTHTDQGGPFVRKEVVFSTSNSSPFQTVFNRLGSFGDAPSGSVQLTNVVNDPSPPVRRYEPGNPDADKDGYVEYPAINPITEMVDLMSATRAYQLNASAVSAAKQMIQESIDILKTT
ncbi:MAG TPA: flagellar basal body rod protein FlgC [Terracidiphilus sp.]|jgi:flagellar basal-body rod protein FlgC|nr:flagellar basal body rod protein FlgC [Terracidiphilus sp.]